MKNETNLSNDALSKESYRDRTGHTIQDYPGDINKRYLLGIDDWGGWYYSPSNKDVKNYRYVEQGNTPELTVGFTLDPEEFKEEYENVADLVNDLIERTIFGHSLIIANKLANETHFSEPQAKVYVLREIHEVSRSQTATLLNKSANTIDNQLSNARKKSSKAKNFIEIINNI